MSLRTTRVSAAAAAFGRVTGRAPAGVWSSPARVNLIGEHTDYNAGLALPVAIDRWAAVAAGVRADRSVRISSLQMKEVVTLTLNDVAAGRVSGWAAYPLGALWGMVNAGVDIPGLDLVINSDIPVGAGLASSAAVEVATALAAAELSGAVLGLVELARCCQAGEAGLAGAPTGVMDQLAVLHGRDGHALLLDCRSLVGELIPFAPGDEAATLMVIDTRVVHSTGEGSYRARRDECAQAAQTLALPSLRDATPASVEDGLGGVWRRRARHVVSENVRVGSVAALLRGGRLREVGPLLSDGHRSLRDDYEVSCAELDLAVDTAHAAGAWGARMTGAGFGGSAIALAPTSVTEDIAAAVVSAFLAQGYAAPRVYAVHAADGAARSV